MSAEDSAHVWARRDEADLRAWSRPIDPTGTAGSGMSGIELLCVADYLGLSPVELAALLGMEEGMVRRWLTTISPGREDGIPLAVQSRVQELEEQTTAAVLGLVEALEEDTDPTVTVYRSDEQLWAEQPELRPFPARWWRHVVMRAVNEVPGVAITAAADGRSAG